MLNIYYNNSNNDRAQLFNALLSVQEDFTSILGMGLRTQCRQRLATAVTFSRRCFTQTLHRRDRPRYSLHTSALHREYNEDWIAFDDNAINCWTYIQRKSIRNFPNSC